MTSPYAASLEPPPSGFRSSVKLSEALMKLSFDDRNKLEEEFHGVASRAVEETPELLKEALEEFDARVNHIKETADPPRRVLRNIVRISRRGDGSASEPNPGNNCYLNDPDVRLRFLRCTFFVVDKAVELFLRFLDTTAEFFGDYVADRPVRRSDFATPAERKALKQSRTQFLPFRDRSGRRIFVQVGSNNYHLNLGLTAKIFVYLNWSVSADVDTQRNGVVLHRYFFDEGPGFNFVKDIYPKITEQDKDKLMRGIRCVPVRVVATNAFFRNTPFGRFLSMVYIWNVNKDRRATTRIHFGELTENLYKMSTFGIPVDLMPITSSGSVKFSNHCAWLDAVEKMETYGAGDREMVDCPLLGDVVFRLGSTSRYNPGNTYYMELIRSYAQEHLMADNKKRYEITKIIYNTITQDRHGRFLEWWDKGKTWTIIQDPEVARQKIAKSIKKYKYKRAFPESPKETPAKESDVTRGNVSALQEYYSKTHPTKRLKISGCDCFTISSDSSKDNSCFGRTFFEIQD